MERYDPLTAPDPAEWQSLDEDERLELVEDFHRRARIRLPKAKAHAIIHVIVENQIALGDEIPVKRTLERLITEGLDRHQSIHAVGSVLVGHMNDLLRPGAEPAADPNRSYYIALDNLTAEDWLRSG
ncbi:MAG TPA: hypothetical protein VEK73_15175 [Xanthobacteraceae bacterium]|nr:hypothetical protein [Xanthobacteraceae bacterium]